MSVEQKLGVVGFGLDHGPAAEMVGLGEMRVVGRNEREVTSLTEKQIEHMAAALAVAADGAAVVVDLDGMCGLDRPRISQRQARPVRLPVAFGSTVAPGFVVWTPGYRLTDASRRHAAAALLFDAIIQNPDRRAENPNCLFKGDDLCLIDHELAFTHRLTLLWTPPWKLGGMKELETPGRHIFANALRGAPVDWGAIKSRWTGLSDARLQEYAGTIPPEWAAAQANVDAAVKLIADARDNIDGCIAELGRVLA